MAQKVEPALRAAAGTQVVRMAPEIATQEDRCCSHTVANTILTLLIRHHPCMLDHDLVRIHLVLQIGEPLETLHTPGQTAMRPGTIALQSLIHLDTVLIGVRHSYWDVVGRHSWNTNPF